MARLRRIGVWSVIALLVVGLVGTLVLEGFA
jgi:hypothetical protein